MKKRFFDGKIVEFLLNKNEDWNAKKLAVSWANRIIPKMYPRM
jgi:hypothetical protein